MTSRGQLTVAHEGKLSKRYYVCSFSYLVTVGVEAVTMLSKRVREVNIQTRLRVDEQAWPPEQLKVFIPLILIQHQYHCNLKQSTAMAEFVERGHIDKAITGGAPVPKHHPKPESHEPLQEIFDTSKVTKEVTEILSPLETSNNPQFVLIEGAPGIGKSLLLKEIAYRWGEKQVLQKFRLVLFVCLRDPAVQQMSLIVDLLQSFCKRDRRSTKIASACSDYLSENNGEDLALLLDGYDEYPEMLQRDSLIADILKRKELPCCGLIVSSRPHASIRLHAQATIKVDILGFTEDERKRYIKESMKGQPNKTDELTQYLQSHSTINSLCFVPFNIVVLVYLYKQGIPLPRNSAELYNYFICLTICRHLTKHGHLLQSNITTLTNLPEPYNTIIQQLSKLSLEALSDNKLIFTFDEIKEACPDITAIPGALNGFGLLQAVEHFSLTGSSSLISDITVKCKVKKLGIDGNYAVGEDEQLYSMLTNPATKLEVLYMRYTKLSSRAAIALFKALMNNNMLKELYIVSNTITDDTCDAVTTALVKNVCLVELYMSNNPITGEAIVNIVNGLKFNNTLAILGLPSCPEDITKKVSSLQKVVNKQRESQGCQVQLIIIAS